MLRFIKSDKAALLGLALTFLFASCSIYDNYDIDLMENEIASVESSSSLDEYYSSSDNVEGSSGSVVPGYSSVNASSSSAVTDSTAESSSSVVTDSTAVSSSSVNASSSSAVTDSTAESSSSVVPSSSSAASDSTTESSSSAVTDSTAVSSSSVVTDSTTESSSSAVTDSTAVSSSSAVLDSSATASSSSISSGDVESSSSSVAPSSSSVMDSSSSAESSSSSIMVSSSSIESSSSGEEKSSSSVVEWACGDTLLYGGYSYKTSLIKERCWFRENVRKRALDGNSICYGGDTTNCETYGMLYDYSAASAVCPTGWRLPTQDEYGELVNYTGKTFLYAGEFFKATEGWKTENGSDKLKFTALPGGQCDYGGEDDCDFIGEKGVWWTSSEVVMDNSHNVIVLYGNNAEIGLKKVLENDNFASVRCIKDEH